MWGPPLLAERDGPPRPDDPGKPLMPQRTTPLWDYWNRDLPSGPTAAWVEEVVDAQRQAGANLLLTPGVPLDQHVPAPALDQLEEHVAWARTSLEDGERLAVNITVEAPWLATPALRTRLLNMIVESDEDTWYVRVKWPFQQSYAQLVDGALLDGYRELSAVMEDEERALLLPTSGGTGWVSLAWGATGFGTGIGSAARGFTTGRPIRRKGPAIPPPPVLRAAPAPQRGEDDGGCPRPHPRLHHLHVHLLLPAAAAPELGRRAPRGALPARCGGADGSAGARLRTARGRTEDGPRRPPHARPGRRYGAADRPRRAGAPGPVEDRLL